MHRTTFSVGNLIPLIELFQCTPFSARKFSYVTDEINYFYVFMQKSLMLHDTFVLNGSHKKQLPFKSTVSK